MALGCLIVVGCSGDDDDTDGQILPDADGGAMPGDGSPDATPARGLKIKFAYLDATGERVSGDQQIEFEEFLIRKMAVQIHNLEFIGDTVESGEQVDSSCVLEFPWTIPSWSEFPSAPPGRYGHLGFVVERTWSDEDGPEAFMGVRLSIRVEGDAMVEPKPRPFVYTDEKKITIDLDIDDTVTEVPATRVLELDLERWFLNVPWQFLADADDNSGPGGDEDGGDEDDSGDDSGEDNVIVIDQNDPTAILLRANLRYAFRLRP